jgi:hypothetical protein
VLVDVTVTGAREKTVITEAGCLTVTVVVTEGVGRLKQLHKEESDGMRLIGGAVAVGPSSKMLRERATVTMRLVGGAVGSPFVERTSINIVAVLVDVTVSVKVVVRREINCASVSVSAISVAVKVVGNALIVIVEVMVVGTIDSSVEQKFVASGRLWKSLSKSLSEQAEAATNSLATDAAAF